MSFLRIVSPITEVYWAGWRSDTYSLQKAGWQIAMQEIHTRFQYQFAFSHPQYQFWGLSEPIEAREVMRFQQDGCQGRRKMPMIIIYHMASDIQLEVETMNTQFVPIDATPNIIKVEIISMADMNIFRTIGNDVKEILVPKPNVASLLNQIIESQAPYQKELREKKRQNYHKFQSQIDEMTNEMTKDMLESSDPRKEIAAQIITV